MHSFFRKIYLFIRSLSVFLIGFDFYVFKVNQSERTFAKRAILKRFISSQDLFKRASNDQRNDHRVALSLALEQYYDGRVECFSSFNRYHNLRKKWLSETGLGNLGIDFIDVGVVAGSFGNLYSLETLIQAKKIGLSEGVNDIVLIKGENFKPRNNTLFSYFEEYLTVVSDPFISKKFYPVAEELKLPIGVCVPMGNSSEYLDIAANLIYTEYLKKRQCPNLLSLRKIEKDRGEREFKSFGLNNYSWHVAVHVRQPGYRDNSSASEDWRNADPLNYLSAVKRITDLGGHVFIMGDPSMKRFPEMANVIDYAHHKSRSEFLDIFIAATSKFCIATASGFLRVPRYFGVPVIFTNCTFALPFYSLRKNDIYLPRLLKRKDGSYLTFQEFFSPPVALFTTDVAKRLRKREVFWVENESGDICLAVEEMFNRLTSANAMNSAEVSGFEQRFHSITETAAKNYTQKSVVSYAAPPKEYLEKYKDLLR